MKKIATAILLTLTLAGCTGRLARLERLFPDGASVTMHKPQLTVSGRSLSVSADEISWVGTNGFAYTTNAVAEPAEPAPKARTRKP